MSGTRPKHLKHENRNISNNADSLHIPLQSTRRQSNTKSMSLLLDYAPPVVGSEVNDVESDDKEVVIQPYPRVDDGLFANDNSNVENLPTSNPSGIPATSDKGRIPNIPVYPEEPINPSLPDYASDMEPSAEFGPRSIMPDMESIPDVNVYQQKKTLAQGMMDLALFSANANQLRYVFESYDKHPYYYPNLAMITISLLLQIAVGVGLIWNAHYNVKDEREICIANKISNFTIIGIFVITVINVFISAFGVAPTPISST